MSGLNGLRVDPLNYVASLESPISVYLKRELFKKESEVDATLKAELYEKMVPEQSADGSWNQLFVRTANNLWNLALLGYDAKDRAVKKGLEWLRSIEGHRYKGIYDGFFHSSNRRDPGLMRSTLYGEFGPGCSLFYQTTYAVYLFHIFGLDDDSRVQTAVKSYLQIWGDEERYCSAWCTLNVLRILIEHPLSRDSKQVENGLKGLAKRQTRTGSWRGFPFYHTFHALSKSRNPLAEEQLERAFATVIKRQNVDGSWGGKSRETMTFLVLDALKNAATL